MKNNILTLQDPFSENPEGLGLDLRTLPEMGQQTRKRKAVESLHPSQIMGADTETVGGKVWLFSTEKGVWEIESLMDLLRILYNDDHSREWRNMKRGRVAKEFFFWNLKFDSQAIFHLLDHEVILDLIASRTEEGEIGSNEITINAETCTYEPKVKGKMIQIRYLEGKSLEFRPLNWKRNRAKLGPVYWWDISQYYNKMRLKTASQIYLNDNKIEKCFDGSILDAGRFDDPEYRDYYREDIDKYAIHDAVLAGRLARRKRDEFHEAGVRFIRPYSLANTAQRACLDSCTVPTINLYRREKNLPILRYALSAYQGGWFETQGSGFYPGVQGIDLASAYPYIMYHLPDIDVRHENHLDSWIMGSGGPSLENWLTVSDPLAIGFIEATFLFEPGLPFYPLAKMSNTGTIVTPRLIRGFFTADEVKEALQWPLVDVAFGRWAYFSDISRNRPFQPFIEKFYRMKMTSPKDSAEYAVSKTMLCSLYGKTIQAVNDKAGKMWNPIYASAITGATRSRLAELVRVNGMSALSIATDGGIFPQGELTRIPNRPLPAPFNLGQWELEEEGDLTLLMSGVYSVQNADFVKTTFRGSASYFLRDHQETGLRGFCQDHAFEDHVTTQIRRPYSAGEARMKGDMSLMNVFAPHQYTIRPCGDTTKRLWTRSTAPRIFGDLLDDWWISTPHESI
mgnify:CR=1 FL=1